MFMESVLLAALVAAAPAPVGSPELDRACFVLMAEMADNGDVRVRSLSQMAAQYFLGRIDAADSAFDPETALASPAPTAERGRLLEQCGDAMQAGGHDFRSIGQALAAPVRPAA